MCVYLGALTHRQEFPPGYIPLSQDLEAVKERWLRGTSLDHRAQPAATPNSSRALCSPRLLRVLICTNQTPTVPVQPCLHLLETPQKQAALTHTRLMLNQLPFFRGCCSSSPCPTQPGGKG